MCNTCDMQYWIKKILHIKFKHLSKISDLSADCFLADIATIIKEKRLIFDIRSHRAKVYPPENSHTYVARIP